MKKNQELISNEGNANTRLIYGIIDIHNTEKRLLLPCTSEKCLILSDAFGELTRTFVVGGGGGRGDDP